MKMNQPENNSDDPGLKWFNKYVDDLENRSVVEAAMDGVVYRCPCCKFKTLEERGGFEICPVCFWEDDGQDDQDADTVRGGPNGSLSLTQARKNFIEFGACEARFKDSVRSPGSIRGIV